MTVRILQGDCRAVLATLPADSVHMVVTSPPYWGLRNYQIPPSVWGGDPACEHVFEGQTKKSGGAYADGSKKRWQHSADDFSRDDRFLDGHPDIPAGAICQRCGAWAGAFGLEPTYQLYVEHAVEVFRAVRRVLRPDGTLWCNLGDSYANDGKWGGETGGKQFYLGEANRQRVGREKRTTGLKPKDLCGIPWRVAFALQDDGWWLRQDIIWSKPNPMPESVTDRCTKAHEYLFLLTKSERYYFDQDAILEDCSPNTHARLSQDVQAQIGSERVPGKTNGNMKAVLRKQDSTNESFMPGATEHSGLHRAGKPCGGRESWKGSTFDGERDLAVRPDTGRKRAPAGSGIKNNDSMDAALAVMPLKRNRRSVWEVATQPFSEAHFATFPPALIEPCILAGCPSGGTVLDPFGGAGTTGMVADRLGRHAILVELNPEYIAMAESRLRSDAGMFAEVTRG